MKTTAALAAALTLASACLANATTALIDGETYTVPLDGGLYSGEFNSAGGAGSVSMSFAPSDAQNQDAVSFLSLSPFPTKDFTGLTMSWSQGGTTLGSTAPFIPETPLFTMLQAATQTLSVSWSGSEIGASFRLLVGVAPTPVPLPAGYLLLGTALCGFLAFGRRGKNKTDA